LAEAAYPGRQIERDLFVGVIPAIQLGFAAEAHPSVDHTVGLSASDQRYAAVLAAPANLGQVIAFAKGQRH
jgi:hypothetical protein